MCGQINTKAGSGTKATDIDLKPLIVTPVIRRLEKQCWIASLGL